MKIKFNTILKNKFKTNDILMIGDSFDHDIIGSTQSKYLSRIFYQIIQLEKTILVFHLLK